MTTSLAMAMITEASCPHAREQVIAGTDPLDAALGIDDLYRLDPAAVEAFRVRFTRAAVDHHRARNPHFDRYCDRARFSSARLEREADLALVPVLPSAIFKRRVELVQSSGTVAPVIHTTSSGTQGTISVIPRDDVTLMRFFATVSIGHREVLGVEAFERQFFNLSPSARDAPESSSRRGRTCGTTSCSSTSCSPMSRRSGQGRASASSGRRRCSSILRSTSSSTAGCRFRPTRS
jgi:hypothetical protein